MQRGEWQTYMVVLRSMGFHVFSAGGSTKLLPKNFTSIYKYFAGDVCSILYILYNIHTTVLTIIMKTSENEVKKKS